MSALIPFPDPWISWRFLRGSPTSSWSGHHRGVHWFCTLLSPFSVSWLTHFENISIAWFHAFVWVFFFFSTINSTDVRKCDCLWGKECSKKGLPHQRFKSSYCINNLLTFLQLASGIAASRSHGWLSSQSSSTGIETFPRRWRLLAQNRRISPERSLLVYFGHLLMYFYYCSMFMVRWLDDPNLQWWARAPSGNCTVRCPQRYPFYKVPGCSWGQLVL